MLVTHFAIAVVAVAASSVLGGSPNLPISPPTSSVGVISPPVTPPTPTPTTMGVSASPPISSTPTLPIGMRRMYDHDYAYPPVPPTMPSASPPVGLPEPVEGLTNSERLARGLPIRGPRLLRVLPGSPLEGLDKDALLHGGMARLPRPSNIPKKRHGPSMLAHMALPIPTPRGPIARRNRPGAPAIGSTDGLLRYCTVSGACQEPKARSGGERDW